jgi:hypothetical protein
MREAWWGMSDQTAFIGIDLAKDRGRQTFTVSV